jgi:hypothetical protein
MRRPGVSFSTTNDACPRWPRSRSTVATIVDVGDPAVGDEDLRAVQNPLVAVAPGGRAQRADVGAGAGLRDRVGAEPDLVADTEAPRNPVAELLGRPRRGDAPPRATTR